MAAPCPGYIDAADVKAIVEKKEPGVTIIDVRDDDYFDGHIKGARQVPSGKFANESEVDRVIESLPAQTSTVVLHCQLSQVRGPKCARRLAERLQSEAWVGKADKPQVVVLRDGFQGFYDQYGADKGELFEKQPPSRSS